MTFDNEELAEIECKTEYMALSHRTPDQLDVFMEQASEDGWECINVAWNPEGKWWAFMRRSVVKE